MASTSSVNFSGLSSGLDTKQLIEDLMSVDSRPLNNLEQQKGKLQGKLDTYTSMRTNLLEIKNKVYELKNDTSFGKFSASSSDEEALTVSASSSASEGTYSVRVNSLAQAETLSSNSYSNTSSALKLSGEIIINNTAVKVRSSDSLTDIKNTINNLDLGATAAVLKVASNDYRLILTADDSGEKGIIISNIGNTDIIGDLGFVDDTESVRQVVDGTVRSREYSSTQSTLGSLLDISTPVSGSIGIRNKTVTIDLASDTLSSVRDKINALGLSGVSASIVSVTENSDTTYQLAISGTQDFTDDNNVLESLGILTRGKSGTFAQFQTNALFTDQSAASSTTNLKHLGAESGETITITGKNTDGSAVSSSLTSISSTKISDVLSAIEEAYGGNVTATVVDGKVTVTSAVAGKNALTFSLTAGNEFGGSLDFGSVSTVTSGRDRQLVAGSNAVVEINNIEINRNTNEINDVVNGITFELRDAQPDSTVTVTVDRDTDAVKEMVKGFVDSFNSLVDYVDENSQYSEDDNVEDGVLLGDQTTQTILRTLRSLLQTSIFNDGSEYNQLVQVGIKSTADGHLEIDNTKLDTALNGNIDDVISLFTATRTSTDNDITFAYHSILSKAGTYDVNITQAAEQASVTSNAVVGAVGIDGPVSVTDNYGNTMAVDITADMSTDDIADGINEEAAKTYARIRKSDASLTTSTGDPVTQNTLISEIDGATVTNSDTITVSATNRGGNTYQRILTLGEGSETSIQDILNAIEQMNDSAVIGSVTGDGKLMVEDKNDGTSKIDVSIETTVDGLDFGAFTTFQEGRNEIAIGATITDDNRLVLHHDYYGSKQTFTASGLSSMGITDQTYAGVDVAGTINGKAGIGDGQSLKALQDDESTRGMVLRVTISPDELALEGPSQGTITLVSGVADLLYSSIDMLSRSTDGFLQIKLDGFESSIDNYNDRIYDMGRRLEQRRQNYVRKFTQLELAMAKLQSLSQQLNSSLGSLSTSSLFSSMSG